MINFRESLSVIMFAFGLAFSVFTGIRLLMNRQYPCGRMFALITADLALMSFCNGIYFYSASEYPLSIEHISMFLFLCYFTPVSEEFFIRCLSGRENHFPLFRCLIRSGTVFVFAAGIILFYFKQMYSLLTIIAYGWMFIVFVFTAVIIKRDSIRSGNTVLPGDRLIFRILYGLCGTAGILFAAAAADMSLLLMGLWILLVSLLFLVFLTVNRLYCAETEENTALGRGRYEHSKLEHVCVNETVEQLEKIMRNMELFRDPKLRLGDVAERLGINSSQLSELINMHMKQSFTGYINGFRIIQAQKELAGNPERSIIEIGFECGFTKFFIS